MIFCWYERKWRNDKRYTKRDTDRQWTKEKNKKRLNELNDKADNLQNKSNQITEIIDNLKPSKLNKNNFTISNKEVEEIKDYIKQTTDTTSNLKSTNDLT